MNRLVVFVLLTACDFESAASFGVHENACPAVMECAVQCDVMANASPERADAYHRGCVDGCRVSEGAPSYPSTANGVELIDCALGRRDEVTCREAEKACWGS